ncbi:toprim domain-containing protein [Myxococcus sp. MISCRS1]|uniref:toprim domain-containing protein n=1 Tax=Myxococcus sp. MISCRS1 TaxID=2996786 RepID=UPI00226F896A|nr:toprim domain-containing protein [Myxococcus sp. MISCRS1]MCY1003966.1 toprim domain-containing protein [Myxococcus sp. MISCRS1]
MDDNELQRFKSEISLPEYAATLGYTFSREESSRAAVTMRHPATDDKVIIKRSGDGHFVYFSVRDDNDNGTIIDFCQRRNRGSLGQVRKELRSYMGDVRPKPPLPEYVHALEVADADRPGVQQRVRAMHQPETSQYLNSRGIRPETLTDPRFAGTWREDSRGNAIFLHRDVEGVSGYEVKNRGYTGFAKGGIKAVWASIAKSTDKVLVLTEATIDAFSYHQLRGGPDHRYASTGGALSPHQHDLIARMIRKMPEDGVVITAFDKDAGGDKLAATCKEIAAAVNPRIRVERAVPSIGKDWNDELKAREQAYIRTVEMHRRRAVGRSRGVELAR